MAGIYEVKFSLTDITDGTHSTDSVSASATTATEAIEKGKKHFLEMSFDEDDDGNKLPEPKLMYSAAELLSVTREAEADI